jgi:hypothetical protein
MSNSRTISRVGNLGNPGDTTKALWYQGESVTVEVFARFANRAYQWPAAATTRLTVWAEGAPETLYVDKAGTVSNDKAEASLTPAESNLAAGDYRWQLAIYDSTTFMGVAAAGELVVETAPQTGLPMVTPVPVWPTDLADMDDVAIGDQTNGQVLAWNSTTEKWEPSSAGAGTITGVTVSGIATGGGSSGSVNVGVSESDVVTAIAGKTIQPGGVFKAGALAVSSSDGNLSLMAGGGTSGVSVLANGNVTITGLNNSVTITGGSGGSGTVSIVGSVTASGTVTGTATPAAALSGFSIASSQLSGALPAISGASLTSLNADNIASGTVADARLSTAARVRAITGGAWVGPKVTETPGWALKSYATSSLFAIVPGFVAGATQAAATATSTVILPDDATAFKTNDALEISLIGDSTNSAAVKFTVSIYCAGSATPLHTLADQVLGSTSAPSIVTIAASSLGTITAGALYTVEVVASVTTSGLYFVAPPRWQVVV